MTREKKKKALEWQEYDEIAKAIDSVKQIGYGEVNLKITDAKLAYIEITTGVKIINKK